MPPPSTPLRLIDANIRSPRTELSPYLRGQIAAYTDAGLTPTQIKHKLSLPKSTIQTTIQRDKDRDKGNSKPRTGRTSCYTPDDERRMLRIVRKEPKITCKALKSQIGLRISTTTIKRIFCKHGIAKWRAAKRPTYIDAKNCGKKALIRVKISPLYRRRLA
jgi:transposase